MNNSTLFIITLVLFLIVILGTSYLFYFFVPYTVQEAPIFVTVGDKVGIDVNTTALVFGTIEPGFGAERTVKLYAPVDQKIFLHIEGIDFIRLEEKEVILEANETKYIAAFAEPPEDTEKKKYEGKLVMVIKEL